MASDDRAPASVDDAEELRLVDRLRRGNVGAFDAVYARYGPRVFSFLLRLSGRRDTAEDLAQEVWLKLAKAAPGLREDTRLGPLLFTIARNAFLSHRRWAMLDLSRLVTIGLVADRDLVHPPPDVEHERAREIAVLEAALQAVPLASREVLLLVGVEGLEQEEVATLLGISYQALRQRLSRARAQLAEQMATIERRAPNVRTAAAAKAERG